jgi:hypothetical protein
MSGSFTFSDLTNTTGQIKFTFFGSTSFGAGMFDIDLSSFQTTDGDKITNIIWQGGLLSTGNFDTVSFNGTSAVFTGSTTTDFGGQGSTVVFDVTMSAVTPSAVPELSTWAMMVIGFASLGFAAYRVKRNRLDAAFA